MNKELEERLYEELISICSELKEKARESHVFDVGSIEWGLKSTDVRAGHILVGRLTGIMESKILAIDIRKRLKEIESLMVEHIYAQEGEPVIAMLKRLTKGLKEDAERIKSELGESVPSTDSPTRSQRDSETA